MELKEAIKKIWIINHSATPPELGGLNRHYYFSKYLTLSGYDVKIITASMVHNTEVNIIGKGEKTMFKEQQFGDVVYTFLKTSGYHGNGIARIVNFMQFPLRLMRHYKKLERPDLVYASSPSPFAAFAAIRIAKKQKLPVILEVRDLWPESLVVYGGYSRRNPVIRLMYRMEKWMYVNADRIVFTFEGGKDYVKEKGWENDVDPSKIYYINNGVDIEEFDRNQSRPLDDAEMENSPGFHVVYTGSIRKSYRLGDLLDTAKLIEKTHPDIKFDIWGDGNEKKMLEQRLQDEHIGNVFFKGHVGRGKIPAVLAHADVNILHVNPLCDAGLARFGCSPNKLFDYLASGKPIISNFRPNYDIIESSGCGIISASTSPADIAGAILRVYEMDRDEYRRCCENARATALQYDYKKLAAKVDGVIQGIKSPDQPEKQ